MVERNHVHSRDQLYGGAGCTETAHRAAFGDSLFRGSDILRLPLLLLDESPNRLARKVDPQWA